GLTALMRGLWQDLADRRSQSGMIVRHDELHPVQATLPEADQEVAPARGALAVGQLDGQHAAPAVKADADGDQHGLAADHPRLAHTFVTGVEDEIGKDLAEPPVGKLRQLLVQSLDDRAHRRGRGVSCELILALPAYPKPSNERSGHKEFG